MSLTATFVSAGISFLFLVLVFPLEAIIGFIAFRGIWAIYIHSNVRLPTGPLKVFLGAPELHHWHHDCARDAGNYANISPLMDILFGTYRCPDHEPERLGLCEPGSTSYVKYMIQPLLPRAVTRASAERKNVELPEPTRLQPMDSAAV